MSRIVLFDYYRSSAAYRVRIALNLKKVDYERRQVNLLEGEQRSAEYRAVNPQGLVPPLIPAAAVERAHVVAMAMAVACDIHPLNNLRVLKYLKGEMGQPQEAVDRWYAHWIREGLAALEAMAAPRAGKFLFRDGPTGADVC